MRSLPGLRHRSSTTRLKAWSPALIPALTTLGLQAAVLAVPTISATAAEDDRKDLTSGVEGSKAALVRIEVSATTEIVHIDHTSGDVQLSRGRYEVPVSVGTGVVTSADGIIATANENLKVDEIDVGIYAANMLFTKAIGVSVKGNRGDPARPGNTDDPYWHDHLQHCYDREEHCVLFVVPNYKVFTYTSPRSTANAELINRPTADGDVALLQVGGGGGMPSARLAPDSAKAQAGELIGFTGRPGPDTDPEDVDVEVDADAAHVGAKTPLASPLHDGLVGGPVVDRENGDVLGLVFSHEPSHAGSDGKDPGGQFIAESEIRRAMDGAGQRATPSQFDAVFRRGVDQLASGDSPDAAVGSLKESRTYYPSALAAQHLKTAQTGDKESGSADGGPRASDDTGGGSADWLPGGWMTLAALLLLVGASAAVLLRGHIGGRKTARSTRGTGTSPSPARSPARAAPPPRTGASGPREGSPPPRADSSAPGAGAPPAGVGAPPPGRGGSPNDSREARTVLRGQVRTAAYCTSCGERLPTHARFCANCGEPIG